MDRNTLEHQLRGWLRTHHGVISRAEVLSLGGNDPAIQTKVRRGEWDSAHRGVYRSTAAPPTPHQALRAALLASGPDAVASHCSAAWLWGLLPNPPPQPELTVPTASQHGRHESGLIIHRYRDLHLATIRERYGIPTTGPLRVLIDLAGSAFAVNLADVLDRGQARKLITIPGLLKELDGVGRSGRPGPGPLRQLLDDRGYIGVPHPSVLESKTLRLFRRYHLPVPTVEFTAGPDGEYRLDFALGDVKQAVEVDGYVYHFSPDHLQRDHASRNRLQRAGWLILVYTWRDIVREPARVAAEIAETYRALTAKKASRPA
ncbi:MAG TPA: DUF559 domain-containing protein [Acidimicrobiales bacterium]|nr:DUF559 domain-containing protein [Acidimicrobiales bacterium]